MPKIDRLAKLLEAVAAQNWAGARAIGSEIAEGEEGIGHHSAAQLLRGALNPNGQRFRASPPSNGTLVGDPGLLAAALTPLTGAPRLEEIALRPAQRKELLTLVAEWRFRKQLEDRGIPRRRKLLFHGPPGCGKSLTAHALGTALSLPTYVIRIDAVVGAYLGQTAMRIRELFHFAESTACVLLLDEVDALGGRRGNQRDVGELDRVAISLMQELEHRRPNGIVIATSNLPQQLDEALFRRFDQVFEFPPPSRAELFRFSLNHARSRELVPAGAVRRLVSSASSYAEAVRRITAEERTVTLQRMTRNT
jgi:SpoVK/Ycf46/Vps4 family AAA+-type ATPase